MSRYLTDKSAKRAWDTQVFFSVVLGVVTAVGFTLVAALMQANSFLYTAAIPLGAAVTVLLVTVVDAKEDRKFAEFTQSRRSTNAAS